MKTYINRIVIAMCLAITAWTFDVHAQNAPASYASAGTKLTFAKSLGYKQPGVGFVGAAGIALPHNLYLTEELDAVKERKTFLPDGHTIASTTGLQYHLKGGWFGRAALFAANHSNSAYSKTATRFHVGGGYSAYARGQKARMDLPAITLGVVAFAPISDPNSGRGVKLSAESFWAFGRWWGLHAKGIGSVGSFLDTSSLTRRRANYWEFQFGLFVNLSAIIGS